MPCRKTLAACFAWSVLAAAASAQSITEYQTTPDLLEALSQRQTLHFSSKADPAAVGTVITIDESQTFQQMDGFGASLTDAAAWLFARKLAPQQADAVFKTLFSRKDGIALSFLRQPVGSSDLAVSFYSFDDLCHQADKACTTAPDAYDFGLNRFTLAHDQDYILPLLRKALALNPAIKVMLTPWSPPGWMKSSGSMLGSNAETKQASTLTTAAYSVYALYLSKTIQGYQAAGVPIYAISVQNEPLYAPPTYSGMHMSADEQADFIANALAPALTAAHLSVKVMAYDHNWDHPEYPETVLKMPAANAAVAGTAWHHYGGDPAAMGKFHDEFPQKDQWVTESSGGTWQKGDVLAQEAAELVTVTRNWAKSYVLWALATDQDHGPHVGGCGTCRGLVTIDLTDPAHPVVKPELDYYVLGHASKFLQAGAVRIGSDEPADGALKDVAFRNPDGSFVLYVVNTGTTLQNLRIAFRGKTAASVLPAGSVATFLWKQ